MSGLRVERRPNTEFMCSLYYRARHDAVKSGGGKRREPARQNDPNSQATRIEGMIVIFSLSLCPIFVTFHAFIYVGSAF